MRDTDYDRAVEMALDAFVHDLDGVSLAIVTECGNNRDATSRRDLREAIDEQFAAWAEEEAE